MLQQEFHVHFLSTSPFASVSDTGDKNPYTEPVYAKYMLVICLEYQNYAEPEYAKFFQNMLNDGTTISQPSILWDWLKNTDPL